MGIPLPGGAMAEAATVLATNDYMGWRKCTAKEAQICANDGTAAMAVKGNEIYIVKAEPDGKDEVATVHSAGDTVSIPSQLADQEDVQFYSYSAATTLPQYGCGGQYRPISSPEPHCFGYAMLLDKGTDGVPFYFWNNSHKTEDYSDKFEKAINAKAASCRRIQAYDSSIEEDEYRVAVRAPNYSYARYHVIYQLSDGTWAGKDMERGSQHFMNLNPSYHPEMWSNDTYEESAGTIYFAVKPKK